VVGWAAPHCLASPFAGLDPLVRQHWYLNVSEGLPLWQRPFSEAIPAALQCLFALGVAIFAALRGEPQDRSWWRDYAVILAVAIVAGLATYRSIAFAGLLATIPLGWFAAAMFARWQASRSVAPKLGVAAALYAVFLPAAIVNALPSDETPLAAESTRPLALSSCELHRSTAALDRLPAGTIFAPLDMGAHLLLFTDHRVVASAHHRAHLSMREVIRAFTSEPDAARDVVLASGADYFAACLDQAELEVYRKVGGPGSLAAALHKGAAPAWLEPVSLDVPETLGVWRVRAGR
jgi:hypothetical protein